MNTENKNEIFAVVEAILFAAGDVVNFDKIAEALEITTDELMPIIEDYEKLLYYTERGVMIVRINDGIRMVTKEKYHSYISHIMTSRAMKNLSQSALEVLSIIAYNQPVTKAAIDNIRGVDSYNSLCRLMERELIEQRGTLNTIGHPKIYGTTDEFLRMFGLVTLEDLPKAEGQTLEQISANKELTLFDTVIEADDDNIETPDYEM